MSIITQGLWQKIGIGLAQVLLLLSFSFSSMADEYNNNWRGLAIDGYDVVAYFDQGKPVEGKSKFSTKWKGAKWRFSSAANLEKFTQAPEEFAPQYGGHCAYAAANNYVADVDPEAWDIVDGKLYLNYSKDVRTSWRKDIPGYIAKADTNWPALSPK